MSITNEFIGREWLFDEILKFVNISPEKFLFVIGEPGSGKTSICLELQSPTTMNIERSLLNIACLAFQYFTRITQHQTTISTQIDLFTTQLNQLLIHTYALDYALDPTEERLDATLANFGTTILSETPSLIVIDNIDACLLADRARTLQLLTRLQQLPQWIKVLFTSNSSTFNRLLPRYPSISLDNYHSNTETKLTKLLPIDFNGQLTAEMIEKANVMMLSKSMDLIRADLMSHDEFEALSKDLNGLYQHIRGKFETSFATGLDQNVAKIIVGLFLLKPMRILKKSSIYKRIRVKQPDLDKVKFDGIFQVISSLFLSSNDEIRFGLFHWTLHDSMVKANFVVLEAVICETLFYWRRLCKFGCVEGNLLQTSTLLDPISEKIEYIDDQNEHDRVRIELNRIEHERHLHDLDGFRRCLSRCTAASLNELSKALRAEHDLHLRGHVASIGGGGGEKEEEEAAFLGLSATASEFYLGTTTMSLSSLSTMKSKASMSVFSGHKEDDVESVRSEKKCDVGEKKKKKSRMLRFLRKCFCCFC